MDIDIHKMTILVIAPFAYPSSRIRRHTRAIVRIEQSTCVKSVVISTPTEVIVKKVAEFLDFVYVVVDSKVVPPALLKIAIYEPGMIPI